MDWIIWAGVIAVVAVAIWYFGFTDDGRARRERWSEQAAEEQRKKKEREDAKVQKQLRGKPGKKVDARLSEVGKKDGGGLACPKCGGNQFKARRSGKSRAGIAGATVLTGGLGGLAAAGATKQKKVTCVTCGTVYQRG